MRSRCPSCFFFANPRFAQYRHLFLELFLDVHFYAILDGHGGTVCSQWLHANLARIICEYLILENDVNIAINYGMQQLISCLHT